MAYLRIALLFIVLQLCTNQVGATEHFPFTSIVMTPLSPMDGDTDNDGVPDFTDQDSDNDGILDMDEGVVCTTIDLSDENGNTDALNTFNNAMITVGGPNGAIIQIEDPLELNGSAMQDEFIISNEHVLNTGNDSTSLLLGVDHAPGETGPANSLGTNYTFSMPVCQFNFILFDIDRTDEVSFQGTLNGQPVPFTFTDMGACLNHNPGVPSFNSICDVQANPNGMNVFEHRVVIRFDGCIDRLEFDIFDFAVGNGGSFTFLPAPEPVCVAFDTDMDGIPDAFDLDSDNDGIPDAIEACGEIGLVLEDCTLDSNGDGVYSAVPGVLEGICATAPEDFDGDGIPNFIDLDSDGDGCGDATEGGTIAMNPNVTDTGVSDGILIPAAAVDDCGLVLNGGSSICPIPVDDIFLDDTVDGCAVPMAGMITLEKTGSLDLGADGNSSVGDVITFTFEVCNTGAVDVTDITITDPLVTIMGGPIAVLAPGDCDNTTFTGTLMLTQMDIDNLSVENTATANATDENGDPVTTTGSESTPVPEVAGMPGIDIEKTSTFNDEDGNGFADVGETIDYVFTITNTGTLDLTGITVTDPVITVMGGPLALLPAGQMDNTTFSGTYTLTQADIDNGSFMNTATVNGTDPSGNPIEDDGDEMTPLEAGMPGIEFEKTSMLDDANGNGFSDVGESINYVFTVINTGTVDLTNITVTDPIITVMGGPLAVLPAGATDNTTFTGSFILTQAEISNGSLMNSATVMGMDPSGNPVEDDADEMTPLTPAPGALDLLKVGTLNDDNGDGFATAGETITYTFTVTNIGGTTLTNITITDPIVTVVGGPIPSLDPGQSDSTTFTGTFTITQEDINSGSIVNSSIAEGTDPDGDPVTDTSDDPNNPDDVDPDGDGNPDDPTFTAIPQNPMISLLKIGVFNDENGDGFAQAGETFTYIFEVINTGNVTVTDINVTDVLVNVMGGPIPVLQPGESDATTFTAIVPLTQADIDAGIITNTATAGGSDPNGDPVTDVSDDPNNPEDVDPDGDGDPDDPTITLAPQNPDISILKIGMFNDENGDGLGQPGETISYSFIVENTGNVTLTDVTVFDPQFPVTGGPIPVFSPGDIDNSTFTGLLVLTQEDVDNGFVENLATATGTDPSGNPVTDDSDDPENPADEDPDGDGDPDDPTIIPLGQDPLIEILKTGTFQDENGDGFAQVGETIIFQFIITNTGNVTLVNIEVEDALVTIQGMQIPILAPGDVNGNLTGIYTITAADLEGLEIINSATATGTDPNGMPVIDISDDPTNPADVDPEGDGEPDDPTVVPICGIQLDVLTGPVPQCFDGEPLNVASTGSFQAPNGFEILYVLTAQPGNTILEISTSPSNFVVSAPGMFAIHSFIAEVDDPQAANFVDLSMITFGVTTADEILNFIQTNGICADLDPIGTPKDVQVCNINLTKEQVDEELFDDEDVALTFDFVITNNGGFDLTNFDLIDDLVFLPVADPATPINANNVEVTITNIDATTPPNANPNYNGISELNILDGMSGFLQPGESFMVTITTETSVFRFRDAFDSFQINTALTRGTHVDPQGNPIIDVDDISDDPTVFADVDIDDDGDPDDPTPIVIPVCDELVCNNDLVISLPRDCELEVTPDLLLEAPAPLGNFEITFFDEDGNDIGNVLTADVVFVQLLFTVECGTGSCWGQAVIEQNNVPQFDAPCEMRADGTTPEDCMILCEAEQLPDVILSEQDVRDAFGDCGPPLLSFNSREERTGDLCDPNGEIVKIFYTGKVERHGRVEEVDILVQQFAVTRLTLDVDDNGINTVFGFPDDVLINCDAEPDVELDPSIERYSPEFLQAIIPGIDAFPFFYDLRSTIADTMFIPDTIQVVDESMQTVRDTMVLQDLDGDGVDEWVVVRLVDKALVDVITFDTIVNNFAHPKIPIFNVNCNAASSYSDVEFEACGGGLKIVREWIILDWCDSDIFITGNQAIEVRDLTAPQVVQEVDGELVPITMLDDVQVSVSPGTCLASFVFPDLNIVDNCDPSPTVVYSVEHGSVDGNVVTDLMLESDPVQATATVTDDCGNVSEVSFNIIVIDDTPPVAICNTSLQVSLNGANGIAQVFAEDIDENSSDSGCGKITLSVVRLDDYSEVVRDCQDRVVGFRPTSCNPFTNDIDLGRAVKDDCVLSGEDFGQITVAGESVSFCCADVGRIIPVLLIVTDERGNSNQCVVDVEVIDNSSPTIVCTDQTVDCTRGDELLIPAMVGSECVVETPFEVELLNESRSSGVCDGGQVVREWFIDIDRSGDFSTGDAFCTQIVSVSNAQLFDPNTIRWPRHFDGDFVTGTNIECTESNEVIEQPQSIQMGDAFTCTPDEVSEIPVWCDTDCGLVGFSMESDTVRASDACLKIIRRWTIVDWCLFVPNSADIDDENDNANDSFEAVEDWAQGECAFCPDGDALISDPVYFRYTNVDLDGFYTFDQIIVVNDDSRPEITVASNFEVNATPDRPADKDDAVCIGSDIIEASAVDFCAGDMTGANLLTWQITILNADETLVISSTESSRGAQASIMTPEGSPGDVFIIRWNVSDGCGNETTTTTTVTYADRQAPTPICISALTSSFTGTEGVVVWAEEFEFGSFDNCTSSEDLIFSIVRRDEVALSPGDAGFSDQQNILIDCDSPSNFNELRVFVFDADGNGDFCDVSIIIDGECDFEEEEETVGSSILFTGQVITIDERGLSDVFMTIESDQTEFPLQESTDFNGEYVFSNLLTDQSYDVSAFKDDTFINGVSTLDLIIIQQHILGIQEFEDPYSIIASDANRDARVSATDIVELRRLVLGQTDDLAATATWTFVDASDRFFDPSNPFPFTESIFINNLTSSVLNGDFVGVKVGDVNSSVEIPGFQSTEIRSNALIEFSSTNQSVNKGDQVTVSMSAKDYELYGLQFTLQHQDLILQDASINDVSLDDTQIGLFDGRSTISWMDLNPSNATEIVMTFTATNDVDIDEALFFNSSITKAEAYINSGLEIASLNLTFNDNIDQFTLYQNVPNPFSDETAIQFSTNVTGQANIYIMNVNGQQVYRNNMQVVPGNHQFTITRDELHTEGIYYYQVEVNGLNQTKKLIVLER